MIITNNCLGGYIYTHNDVKYDNPFIWSRIYVKSFFELLKRHKTLDFNDVEVIQNEDIFETYKPFIGHREFSIMIENNIRVLFGHVKYDQNATMSYIKKFNEYTGNVYSKYPYKVVYENYLRRVGRMNLENVHFIYMNDAPQFDSKEDLLNLIDYAEKNKIHLLFFTEDKAYTELKLSYVKIIYIPKEEFTQINIVKKYNDILKPLI